MSDVELLCYAGTGACLGEPGPPGALASALCWPRSQISSATAISRSPILQVCLDTSHVAAEFLPVPVPDLHEWLRLLDLIDSASPALRKLSLPSLLHGAQVADKLGDAQTTAAACMHISRRLFFRCPHRHSFHSSFQAACRAVALESLSVDLQILVLRSAPSLWNLLSALPPSLHPTALHARFPSIDTSSSLTLPPLQFPPIRFTDPSSAKKHAAASPRPHPLQLWAAAAHACAQLTQLTRLRSDGARISNSRGTFTADAVRGLRHLSCLSQLRCLELPEVTLRCAGSAVLAETLACMPALTSLDLSETEADMHALAPAFQHLGALCVLRIPHVRLCGCQAHTLARHVTALARLTYMDISYASLRNPDWHALLPSMRSMRTLRVLRLDHNQLMESGVWPNEAGGRVHEWHALEELSLQGNWLLAAGAAHFATAARASLKRLDMTSTGLTAPGVAALALPLCCLSCLEDLRLGGNCLAAEGITELAACFDSIPSVTALDLSGTETNDTGVAVLGMLLPSLPRLQVLQLASNNIEWEGAEMLCRALPGLPLRELDLSYNLIGDEGAEALAGVADGLSQLRRLGLAQAGVGPGGARRLFPALARLPLLRRFDLSCNVVRDVGAACLRGELGRMRALEGMHMGFSGVSYKEWMALKVCAGRQGARLEL
eukprot:jgi/Ulvmu1/1650/UM114_0018.1